MLACCLKASSSQSVIGTCLSEDRCFLTTSSVGSRHTPAYVQRVTLLLVGAQTPFVLAGVLIPAKN